MEGTMLLLAGNFDLVLGRHDVVVEVEDVE